MREDVGRVAAQTGSREPSPDGLGPTGFDPSRDELNAWLSAHCGSGLPYNAATDLASALHGLAYTMTQIERSRTYTPRIGQLMPAATSLRWALDYIARHEMARDSDEHPEGEDAPRLSAEGVAARAGTASPDVPTPSPTTNTSDPQKGIK